MEQNNAKHFLGINWTVRFKNPQFWLAIALSILVPPLAYTGTEFNEVTSWGKFFDILGDGFANPYIVLMMLVGIYNAVVDKTTKGFGDSYIAKQYLKPRTDYDPKQALDWEINVEKKAQAREEIKSSQQQKLEEEKQQEEPTQEMQNLTSYEEADNNESIATQKVENGADISDEKEYDTREDFSDDNDEVYFYDTLVDGGGSPDESDGIDEEIPVDDSDEGFGQREETNKEVK